MEQRRPNGVILHVGSRGSTATPVLGAAVLYRRSSLRGQRDQRFGRLHGVAPQCWTSGAAALVQNQQNGKLQVLAEIFIF
ncbi:hypothetical protein L484_009920 [Morus notabilis]|uniref:Uncharacterized protein n=1 Tax=Morus notabilis TaxID=981085 RepID=W9QC11_9ROSA|nr:hypothetical protein L484_009920 [Morus notabilis]